MLIERPPRNNGLKNILKPLRTQKGAFWTAVIAFGIALILLINGGGESGASPDINGWVMKVALAIGVAASAWASLLSIHVTLQSLHQRKPLEEPYFTRFLAVMPPPILVAVFSYHLAGEWTDLTTKATVVGIFFLAGVIISYALTGGSGHENKIRKTYPNVNQYMQKHQAPNQSGVSCFNCNSNHLGSKDIQGNKSTRLYYCKTCDTRLYWT